MVRERIAALAARDAQTRLVLVTAPAGSGKSTLLAHLALESERVAWLRLERADAPLERFLARLEDAILGVERRVAGEWRTVEQAISCLDRDLETPVSLVLDDLDSIRGSRAEHALRRLMARTRSTLVFFAASRVRPNIGLARLRVAGEVVEITADDLRFRSWEVERLFHEFYGEPLPPNDLAELARRTEGWAAGLQLFHLATRGKSLSERRRMLSSLGPRWNLVREYLAQNVLDDLPAELRDFLIETSVLTKLSGALCDALLERRGSETLLVELERRQIFTFALGDGSYRYHEVLRSHLETLYVERADPIAARSHYRRAASLLERSGALPDAVRAYCRAEAWADVTRVLGQNGERLSNGRAAWVEHLPATLVVDDPWLNLAVARQEWAAGRIESAAAAYRDAERLFGEGRGASICRRERARIDFWLAPSPTRANEPLDLIRAASIRDPVAARRRAAVLDGPFARLAGGVAALCSGHVADATALLAVTLEDPDATPELAAVALLASAVSRLLAGSPEGAREVELAAEEAERLALPWVARTARAALALTGSRNGMLEAAAARVTSEHAGDRWGVHVDQLFEGLGALRAGLPAAEQLDAAVAGFRTLNAGVLEAWARGALALAAAHEGAAEPRQAAVQAEVNARLAGSRAGQALAYLALACSGPNADEYVALAAAVAEETGLVLPLAAAVAETPRSLEIRLFGGLELAVLGRPVDLRQAKPRSRRALRYLAVHAGQPVHRETLMEVLWPGADPATSTRNLHVLISSLRHVLEPGIGRGQSSLIVREDEAYQLRLRDDARVDLIDFDREIADGRRAESRGRTPEAAAAFERALALYRGELLPEEGPSDWIVDEREARRAAATEAAHGVAAALLAEGRPLAAAAACERGLAIDRQHDDLWRLCAGAYERAGDPAAAARARAGYERMLRDLGIGPLGAPG
jgi:DNA-binding SARP family transcriptional activator